MKRLPNLHGIFQNEHEYETYTSKDKTYLLAKINSIIQGALIYTFLSARGLAHLRTRTSL